jgi:hypothetical protein
MGTQEPRIGRFLFDSITKGMYENPLCIFREYIQNSADSLDKAFQAKDMERADAHIQIDINPATSTITIEDNGPGLTIAEAPAILTSIGDSTKFGQRNRGFRGIGRLGGMAYCKHISFTTKAQGEAQETVNCWDCHTMGEMLSPHSHKHRGADLRDVIQACSTFEVAPSKYALDEPFFRVEMHGVHSAKGVLTNIDDVRSYLAQVAPLPFDYQKFPFGRAIDESLRKNVLSYNTYKVFVNDEELFKPYCTTVRLGLNKSDTITGVVNIEVLDGAGKIIGRGWRADRKDFLGAILRTEGVDGIRVRVGNILLGDNDLLDKVFRQLRFNAYFVGEIHSVDPTLVPNGRRDDFEPSEIRETFYDELKKALGDPLSKLVQKKSSENSKTKAVSNAKQVYLEVKSSLNDGFVSDSHKEKAVSDLRNSCDELEALTGARDLKLRSAAEAQIKKCNQLLSQIEQGPENITCSLSSSYSRQERELLGHVFKHIYTVFDKAEDPVKLCRLIVQKMNADRKQQ